MQMDFSGRSAPPRVIALGGRSGVTGNREEALARAAAERAARDGVRRQQSAATRVQAMWRGYAARARARHAALVVVDGRVSDVARVVSLLAAAGRTFSPPLPAVVALVRAFAFAPPVHTHRLSHRGGDDGAAAAAARAVGVMTLLMPPGCGGVPSLAPLMTTEPRRYAALASRLAISLLEASVTEWTLCRCRHVGSGADLRGGEGALSAHSEGGITRPPLSGEISTLLLSLCKGSNSSAPSSSTSSPQFLLSTLAAHIVTSDAAAAVLHCCAAEYAEQQQQQRSSMSSVIPLLHALTSLVLIALGVGVASGVSSVSPLPLPAHLFDAVAHVIAARILTLPLIARDASIAPLLDALASSAAHWPHILSAVAPAPAPPPPASSPSSSSSIIVGAAAPMALSSPLPTRPQQPPPLVWQWQNPVASALALANIAELHTRVMTRAEGVTVASPAHDSGAYAHCLSRLLSHVPVALFALGRVAAMSSGAGTGGNASAVMDEGGDEWSSEGGGDAVESVADRDPDAAFFIARQRSLTSVARALAAGNVCLTAPAAAALAASTAAAAVSQNRAPAMWHASTSAPPPFAAPMQYHVGAGAAVGGGQGKRPRMSPPRFVAPHANAIIAASTSLTTHALPLLGSHGVQAQLSLLSRISHTSALAASAAAAAASVTTVASSSSSAAAASVASPLSAAGGFVADAAAAAVRAREVATFAPLAFLLELRESIAAANSLRIRGLHSGDGAPTTSSGDSEVLLRGIIAARAPCEASSFSSTASSPIPSPPSLLTWLWVSLKQYPPLGSSTGAGASDDVSARPAYTSALRLFLQAFTLGGAHLDGSNGALLSLGPSHEGEGAVLSDLLQHLRALLHRLCWSDRCTRETLLIHRPTPVLGLLCDAVAAYNALYERHTRAAGTLEGTGLSGGMSTHSNARRALSGAPSFFAQDSDFLFPSIPASDLSVSVILGLASVEATDEGSGAGDAGGTGSGAGVGGGDNVVMTGAGGGDDDAVGAGMDAVQRGAAALNAAAGATVAFGEGRTPAQTHMTRVRSARTMLVLTRIPQTVPFRTRAALFQELKNDDKNKHAMLRGTNEHGGEKRVHIHVRRACLVEDAFRAFERLTYRKGASILKDRFYVKFFSEDGAPEAGIDGGGLLKEFIDSLVRDAFAPSRGLFLEAPASRYLYPNAFSRLRVGSGVAQPTSGGGGGGGAGGSLISAGVALPPPPLPAPMQLEEGDDDDDDGEGGGDGGQAIVVDDEDEGGGGWGGGGGGGLFEGLGAMIAQAMGGGGGGVAAAAAAPRRAAKAAIPSQFGDHLAHFSFLGRLLGKAVYEGILVAPRFAPFVLRRLLGRANTPLDLYSLDPELAKGLRSLSATAARVRAARTAAATAAGGARNPDAAAAAAALVVDEVEAFGLTFTATDRDECALASSRGGGASAAVATPQVVSQQETALVPGGDTLPVTCENADAYVRALAHHRLSRIVAPQVSAFLEGFRSLVPLPWLSMFSPAELSLLMGGREDLDVASVVADMRAHAALSPFAEGHPFMETFWRVLRGLEPEDLARFLAFVTSVPRPPLLGFATLQPRLGIALMGPEAGDGGGGGGSRLPVAATCMNLLKLPLYATEHILREKLLTAIRDAGGFLLS